MIDLHKIIKEAEGALESNPNNAQAFQIYALAKLLKFIEYHGKENHGYTHKNNEQKHEEHSHNAYSMGEKPY